ncbi:MAG: hypothetical protein ACLQDV_06485 [Candidatus Binataceae bacterium]
MKPLAAAESPLARTDPRRRIIVDTRLAAALTIAAAAWLYCAQFVLPATPFIRLTWAYDEWVNLEGAMRMLAGQRIYIDFFQYTLPGTEIVYLAMFKLWGVRAWIPNAMLLVVGTIYFWIAITVSRRILSGWASVLPAVLFLPIFLAVPDATHHKLSITLILSAMAVLMPQRSRARLAIAGVLIGVATLFTQSNGFVALIFFAGFVTWEKRARLSELFADQGYLIGAYGVVVGVGLAILIGRIGLARLFNLIVVFPIKYYPADSRYNTWRTIWYQTTPTLDNPSDAMLYVLYPLVYALPFAYLVLLFRHRRSRGNEGPWNALILIATAGCSLLAGRWYSPDFGRIAEASLPALIVTVWLISTSKWQVPLLKIAGIAAIAMLIVPPAEAQFARRAALDLPSGRVVFADPDVYHTYQWLLANTRPGDEFLESGDMDDMYVLMHLHNPAPVPYLTANDYTRPEQVRETIAGLERGQVKYILWDDDLDHPVASDAGSDHLAALRDYMQKHYELVTSFDCQFSGECGVYQRTDNPDASDVESK